MFHSLSSPVKIGSQIFYVAPSRGTHWPLLSLASSAVNCNEDSN